MSASLASLMKPLPTPRDPASVEKTMQDWAGRASSGAEAMGELLAFLGKSEVSRNVLETVIASSPFLRGLIERQPAFTLQCLEQDPAATLDELVRQTRSEALAAETEDRLMSVLRIGKQKSALAIALADVGSVWTLEQTTQALTGFADAAVSASVDWLAGDALKLPAVSTDGEVPARGFVVLAMGKYGAGELNYSSDIDLIVLFDPERCRELPSDPSTFYVRLTRKLVKVLQERTGDGYVFRADLRLRPDPGATNVAIALEAAAQYYENMGQNWERAAMIKARPVAGDLDLGAEFQERIVPFIWRKYLDYAAIADIQSLKRQIQAYKGHGKIAVAGHNIKLGRGGIREIEFFVQTQQLIAGGRSPKLRGNRTVPMLSQLYAHGLITKPAVEDLTEAYRFLRMVEHRLQMVDDDQTHSLPEEDERLEDLARFAGFVSYEPFAIAMMHHLDTVQGHYAGLFEAAPGLGDDHGSLVFTGAEDDPETLETLANMGYERPSDVSAIIRGWHFGRSATMRSARARELLTELMPVLLDALARTGHADQALIAFDKFLTGLPAGVQLFSLLKANPHLLGLLADILGTAPRLADILARRSRMLDAVLNPDFFGPLPTAEDLEEAVDAQIPDGPFEEILDAVRIAGREQSFRIGVRLLSRTVAGAEAGRAYSHLAELLISRLFAVVRSEFELRHGKVEGGQAVVVAMGKLGGREMTASSDLDLMLIYDFAGDAEASDGRQPLAPGLYYTRLTQRLINALSAQTAEGMLYEVDMRLRPSGNKGPIATHISSFIDYHEKSAWTWEKLALTRARTIAGDAELRRRMDEAIDGALCQPRDRAATAVDVAEMRTRIAAERGSSDPWDLKNTEGGQVDLEFICQYLQIVNAAENPECLDQNTEAAIAKLADHDLIGFETAGILTEAGSLYSALSQVLRLCIETRFDPAQAPDGLKALLARAGDAPDFFQLESRLADAQTSVKNVFMEMFPPPA